MSLQHPLRRWAFQPLNLNISALSRQSTAMRLPTRRPLTLLSRAQAQAQAKPQAQNQTRLQSQLQKTLFRPQARRAFHNTRQRSNNKSSGSGTGQGYTYQSPNATPSLSQRLKTLSREYGWSALWIYLFLSALDFPFCFAAVKLLGADKIGHYEHVVVEGFKGTVNKAWPGAFEVEEEKTDEEKAEAEKKAAEQQQQKGKKGSAEEASLWTQLALAYAIHKSFIFLRVPLTAAITPKVVKQLRKWGFDIVKGKPRAK